MTMSEEPRIEPYDPVQPSSLDRIVLIDPIKKRYVGLQAHDPLYVTTIRFVEDLRVNVYDDTPTTDDYVESEAVITIDYQKTLLWIKNHHQTNSAVFCIEVTSNTDDWECLLEDAVLAPGESRWEYLVQPWYRTRFKVKSQNEGQPALLEGWITRR